MKRVYEIWAGTGFSCIIDTTDLKYPEIKDVIQKVMVLKNTFQHESWEVAQRYYDLHYAIHKIPLVPLDEPTKNEV